MTSRLESTKRFTVAEYLELERRSPERHEYFEGEIFAMTGGSRRHTQLAVRIAGLLDAALHDRPSMVLGSDMRIAVASSSLYTYPDAVVVCGPATFTDEREETLLNPSLVVEVLSPSTESYDRGRKFEHYRTIASLVDYILVSQDAPLVEHFVRQPSGSWLLTDYRAGRSLVVESIGVSISVDEIYRKDLDSTGDASA
ncbi:MAG: Uma2 family endonuclease [Deltaproteobacteria bacterium]|nr:Uma2 family endonuclease [Deltaproteobacteria bacterium]